MVAPTNLTGPSSLDPLVLLPIPSSLPENPSKDLSKLLDSFERVLGSNDEIPISVLTSQMRLLNRNSHILLNASRHQASIQRDQLDQGDLELRGVLYELEKVRDEIEKCSNYSAGHEDLELPSVEEVLQNGGDYIGSLPDPESEGYEHALMLARLEYELEQIKQREAEVLELVKERDAIIRSNKDIKMKFTTSDTYLTDFARTAGHMLTKMESVVAKPTSNQT